MVDVFISYAREELDLVARLDEALREQGLTTFFDVSRIDGAMQFSDEIDRALKSAKCVIGVWSPHALTRPWVKNEGRVADHQKKLIASRIRPLTIDDIPTEFVGYHLTNLEGFGGANLNHPGYQELLKAVRRKVQETPGSVLADFGRKGESKPVKKTALGSTADDESIQPLPVGLRLGDEFKIDKVLGQGGFGITYLVTALKDIDSVVEAGGVYVVSEFAPGFIVRRNGGEVAFQLRGKTAPELEYSGRMFGEMREKYLSNLRLTLGFNHPNVVNPLLVREANNTGYGVVEKVVGPSLADVIGRAVQGGAQGILWPTLRPIAMSLLDAVEYVHDRGVVHRDIKPANVLLRNGREPVLVDFGGAMPIEKANTDLLFTPGFAPSEQLNAHDGGKTSIGKHSDIYSLAATLYCALAGRPPIVFAGDPQDAEEQPPLFGHSGQKQMQIPDGPARAIDRALDYWNPQARPQTVAQWRSALNGG